MSLLDETKELLELNNKSLGDILWYGTPEERFTTDIKDAFNIEYDSGYGCHAVKLDLLVVGDDWWLERCEYDGSEWWEFRTMPSFPSASVKGVIEFSLYDD